jgi:hypothetical protein
LFACKKAVDEDSQPRVLESRVYLQSLLAGEHDLCSYAVDVDNVLTKVKLTETLNPSALGFKALKIKPTQQLEC